MNFKKLVLIICLLGIPFLVNSADPFKVYPFKLPDKYQEALKDYRSKWTRVTGFEHSGLHWQQFIAVFVNQDAKTYENNYISYLRLYQDYDEDDEDSIEKPKFTPYKPGTIVLKENYDAKAGSPDKALTVTLMIKHKPGYDSEHGDWEYVQFSREGDIILSGKAQDPIVHQVCASCHINIADRDYIFANFFSKQKAW